MIQQAHLTAWQTHAPWPKRSQIEQDLRLSRGVAAIFGDTVLAEHLAMRGGTVLHKGHLPPAARYSEDIDLVMVKSMSTEELDRHLRRVLTPILGQPADSAKAPSARLPAAFRVRPVPVNADSAWPVPRHKRSSAGHRP